MEIYDLESWSLDLEKYTMTELFRVLNIFSKKVLPQENKNLWDIYQVMLHNRHDLLHYFVADMIGLNYVSEKILSDVFREYSNEKLMNKSPDIFFEKENKFFIIDVSITKDLHKNMQMKHDKYIPIVVFLESKDKKAEFIHINLNLQQSNLELELTKLEHLKIKDFDYPNFKSCINIVNDIIITIGTKIDKEFFDCMKKQFLEKNEEFNFGKTDDLTHRTMGKYKDFEIENEAYDVFFEKNKSKLDDIYETSNIKYDEDIFAMDLKDIIENIEKYDIGYLKDKVLKQEDFCGFQEKITKNVESMPKYKSCKPTHHVMVNLDDNEGFTYDHEAKICEQDIIVDFFKTFISEYKHIIGKMNKIVLVYDIISTTNKLFEENDCLKNNRKIFKSGVSSLADELSGKKHTREAIKVYKSLLMRKKPNLTDLVPLKINYSKDNRDDIKDMLAKKYSIPSYFKQGDGLKKYIECLTDTGDHIGNDDFYIKNYIREKNTVKVSRNTFSNEGKFQLHKNGIGVKKEDKNYKPEIERKCVPLEKSVELDEFIDVLKTEQTNPYFFRENEYMYNVYGVDNPVGLVLKNNMIEEYKPVYEKITKTTAFYYSRLMQIIYREMFHHTQMKNPTDTYTFISGGIRNTLVIMANCYVDERKTIGKPFLCIVRTKKPDKYNEVFGKIYKYKLNNSDYWYIITNWRRLSLTKLTYLCDVHTSVLTSTMNSALSNPKCAEYTKEKLINTYTLRTIIGYNTTQKNSEFLMDNRYAYMSVFSLYTNIQKLLTEKFKPPYTNAFQVWFIKRIFDRYKLIFESMKTGGVILSDIVLLHNKRDPSKIGGVIDLPSFWFDNKLSNVFELLDEIFVYVHTMKEPTSIYHEAVKALKTIIDYQNEFDNLDKKYKTGNITCKDEIISYLRLNNKIGFSKPIIMNSVKHTIAIENPNFLKIIDSVNSESIGELISTKAVIADINREVKENKDIKKSKKQILKELKMKKDFEKIEKLTHDEELFKKHLFETNTIRYQKNRSRQKVFETILDVVENNKNITKTIHLANKHIYDGGKTLADICIKSQYGSKREFYVINIEAKASARVTELFFRKLSENSPNEAISVPGDKKILKMQEMIDKVSHNFSKNNQKMLFINGDCTKWSAAETMGSFLSMVDALKPHIGVRCYKHLKATYLSWGMKKIQIPLDIVNNVIPTKKYNTDFLNKVKYDNYKLKSTQNFLQGMFNYSSSYKAVCCMNYLAKIWKKMYPESKVVYEHMEHSDDYVIVLIYSTEREVELFRIAQKIMMRLHGYNDSDRKTSCQPFFMEFVSLISFNGVMLYPQIKKAKECNLNLPCIGYKQDIDAVLSRVKECSRVGCNQTFLYFFQKMHIYHVAKIYSLLPKMKNNLNRGYEELCNTPLELFGMPDPLPLFSLYCKGNVNNYRLYTYGDDDIKKTLYYLYKLTCEIDELDGDSIELKEYGHSLHTPKCVYTVNTKTIKKLRKSLNITPEQVKEFWDENITYHIIKPRNIEKLIPWIKCMFFNRTFIEAYSKQSRAIMTMRLSKVVNGRCFKDVDSIKNMVDETTTYMKNAYTLSEYLEKHLSQLKCEKICDLESFWKQNEDKKIKNLFMKILLNSDVTPTFIYSLLDTVTKYEVRDYKTSNIVQVATQTPHKLKTMNIVNTPGIILQYIYNYNNYRIDNREPISPESIEKDFEILSERIFSSGKTNIQKDIKVMELLAIFNDISLSMDKRIVTFCYDRNEKAIGDVIMDIIKFNMFPDKILNVQTKGVVNVYDPYTNKLLYTRGKNTTIDFLSQCVDNIFLLFIFFVNHRGLSITGFKNLLDKIKFDVVNRFENNTLKEHLMFNYKELFEKITPQYYKTYKYNLNQKKIIAFLKSVLMGENDLLDNLVESQYIFGYRYTKTSTLKLNKYIGYTEVTCNYIGNEFLICYNNEKLENPVILVNGFLKKNVFEIYNIGLRLTQNLNDENIEENISVNRLKKEQLSKILSIIPEGYIDNFDYVMIECQGTTQYKRLSKIKHLDICVYPVFSVSKQYPKFLISKHKVMKRIYYTNTETLSIWHDDKKLFTVPYWDISQHDNMHWDGRDVLFDVNIPTLLKDKTIEKYLFNGYVCGSYKSTIEEKDIVPTLLEKIKYNKIYTTDFLEIKEIFNEKNKNIFIPNKMLNEIFVKKIKDRNVPNNMRYLPNITQGETHKKLQHISNKIQNFEKITKGFSEIPSKKQIIEEIKKADDKTKEYKNLLIKMGSKYNQFLIQICDTKYPLYCLKELKINFYKKNMVEEFSEGILNYCIENIPLWWAYSVTDKDLRYDLFKDYVEKLFLNGKNIKNNLFVFDLKTALKIENFDFLWESIPQKYVSKELSILNTMTNNKGILDSFVDENEIINVDDDLHFEIDLMDCDTLCDQKNDFQGFLFETEPENLKNTDKGFQITANNIFVNMPGKAISDKTKQYKEYKKEKGDNIIRNNLLKRIYGLPDINVLKHIEFLKDYKCNYNYYEFTQIILYCLKTINFKQKYKNNDVKSEVLLIYHLLCNSYINNGFKLYDDEKICKYIYDGLRFIPCVGVEFDLKNVESRKDLLTLKEDCEIMDITFKEKTEIIFWIETDLSELIKMYDFNIKNYYGELFRKIIKDQNYYIGKQNIEARKGKKCIDVLNKYKFKKQKENPEIQKKEEKKTNIIEKDDFLNENSDQDDIEELDYLLDF